LSIPLSFSWLQKSADRYYQGVADFLPGKTQSLNSGQMRQSGFLASQISLPK
jgi:hypothetical protein